MFFYYDLKILSSSRHCLLNVNAILKFTNEQEGLNMSAFDKIIGYEDIKKDLIRIADTLKNMEVYRQLGVTSPKGLLLHGEPGVGKSLMAECIIEESGRNVFVCRKAQANEKFVETIKETFVQAAENAPSIIYLDDMDKFANDDEKHRNSEEYVTVQSCIDEVKDKEVFVLATANEMRCLPRSLKRVGRFDRIIEVEVPKGEDAILIIDHYLETKKLSNDLDSRVIAGILAGKSCAALETCINEAGVLAGFKRKESITMDEMAEACMNMIFYDAVAANDEDRFELDYSESGTDEQILWHEAGHTVVGEVLYPNSVVFGTAQRRTSRFDGFVKAFYLDDADPLFIKEMSAVIALGGRAATELHFGCFDAGCDEDLQNAFNCARSLYTKSCLGGLSGFMKSGYGSSELQSTRSEIMVATAVEIYYRKAKEILCKNWEFLEKIVEAYSQKEILLASDISAIRESCEITEVTL